MPEKIQALKDWPTPNCLTDVRAFVGLASYYRKFVRSFAIIAEPLTALMTKKVRFTWSQEAQQAFERLKEALMEITSLSFPVPYLPCILDTDASDVAIGTVLSHKVDDEERPIASSHAL